MKVAVVGAGAWGLPAAAELSRRGHEVVLVDRYGPGNLLSSSPGPTRIWRLNHPDAVRVRLALRSVEAWERLESLTGRTVHLRRGQLWRDDVSAPAVAEALRSEGVAHTVVDPADVGRFFPGLRADDRPAVWQDDAGPVLAAESIAAHLSLFSGEQQTWEVAAVETTGAGVRLVGHPTGEPHGPTRVLDADLAVLAPGPGAGRLLPTLGVDLPLRPSLEQVVHCGDVASLPVTDALPCLYDGPVGDAPGAYAMPTPGVGYKLGQDLPLRWWTEEDLDRTPDPAVTETIRARIAHDIASVPATVIDAQVCSWTESPDGRFVIDTLPGGVVLACGDSGEGFKFSALMGLVLADLAEGRTPDADVATFHLDRFGPDVEFTHVLGR